MTLINISLLILIVIESACLVYLIGFHPDAKNCDKLEKELRETKKENDKLLKQIQDLNYQIYVSNWRISQYDEKEVARMKELLNESMKKYTGTDSDVTYDKDKNQYRIKSKDN